MGLELTFLGSGTSAGVPIIGCQCAVCTSNDPRDQRSRPSVMISYAQPHAPSPAPRRRLIIDTGPDLRTQMIRHQVQRIDGVLLTHSHADHIFGLDDLRRFNAVMNQPINLYAEEQTMRQIQKIFSYIFNKHSNINQTFIADLIPNLLETETAFSLFGAVWTPLRLMHGKLPILGFRVDHVQPDGQTLSLAYCTDVSSIPPQTYPLLTDLDILVIDGLRERHHPTHLTIGQALEQIQQIRPRQAYLTHIAHDLSHARIQAMLPPNVEPAYDGLVVNCTTFKEGKTSCSTCNSNN